MASNVVAKIYDQHGGVLDIIPDAQDVQYLDEVKGPGTGLFRIPVSYERLVQNPSIINYKNIIEVLIGGVVRGAWIIRNRHKVIVGSGEEASLYWEISGPGLRDWFHDAIVYPQVAGSGDLSGAATLQVDPGPPTPPVSSPILGFPPDSGSTATGWTRVWNDEFLGTSVNTATWTVDNGTTFGSGNAELELNMAANVTVGGDMLTVEARHETVTAGGVTRNYTSGHLSSKGKREFSIGPGQPLRVEVRAQLPDVTHLLPCPVWLRPSDGGNGEVDSIEATGTTDTDNPSNQRISQSVHVSYSPSIFAGIETNLSSTNGVKDWHVYAFEVFSDHVKFEVDGVVTGTITAQTAANGGGTMAALSTIFNTVRSWYMHITLGVGGNWPGTPDGATTFPADMNVDYIRVYRQTQPTTTGGSTGGVTSGGTASSSGTSVPFMANDFIDRIAVDIHSSYTGTLYANTSLIVSSLVDLGITHIRDGLRTGNASLNSNLASHGIKYQLIVGNPGGLSGMYSTGQHAAAISALKGATWNGVVESLEGPNEWDLNGGSSWASDLRTFMAEFYPAIRGDSYFSNIPFKAPSMAHYSNYTTFGVDTHNDGTNLHSYFGPGAPETNGTLAHWLAAAQTSAGGGREQYVSEWGYHTSTATNYVDEATQADYTVRGIFMNAMSGVRRASSYELFDEAGASGREAHFGLVRADGSSKPSYHAVKNLIGWLKDSASGPTMTNYPYSFTSPGSDVKVVPIGRKDGSIDFAVWRTAQVWDYSTSTRITVPPVNVGFTIGSGKTVVSFRPGTGVSTVVASSPVTAFTIPADGQMTIVRVG